MKEAYVFYNEDDHAVSFFAVVEESNFQNYLESILLKKEEELIKRANEVVGPKHRGEISVRRIPSSWSGAEHVCIEVEVLLHYPHLFHPMAHQLYDSVSYQKVQMHDTSHI